MDLNNAEKKTSTVSISTWGGCVTRDIFRIADVEAKFSLTGNIGFVSPVGLFADIHEDISEIQNKIEACDEVNFTKRNAILQLQNKAWNHLINNKGEYLIFDIIDLRFPLLVKGNQMITYRFANTEGIIVKECMDKLGFKTISIEEIPLLEIQSEIDKFCDALLSQWDAEHIFFINEKPCSVLNANNKIKRDREFSQMYKSEHNGLLRYFSEYIIERLGCHIIEMPSMQYLMANKQHTFGTYIYHYTDVVYKDMYNQICNIIFPDNGYDTKVSDNRESLKKEYYQALRGKQTKTVLSNEILDCLSITNLKEYLQYIYNMEEYIAIISIKDTAGYFMDENIQNAMRKLGLTESLVQQFMIGYIAVLKNGMVIYERKSSENESLEYLNQIDYYTLEVTSKPYLSGNEASIYINGVDYACNNRGINLVLVDLETNKIVDSVSWDTHVCGCPCFRKTDILSNEDKLRVDLRKIELKLGV